MSPRSTGSLKIHAPGNVKLVNSDLYWLRVGDYRVVYEIHDDVVLVLVLAVGHRREIYREF